MLTIARARDPTTRSEILIWEVMEKGQAGPSHKTATGWNLLDFKRSDGTPEEQEQMKEARAEARKRWRVRPTASRNGGRNEEEVKWIRDTAADILDEFVKQRRV